MTRKTAMIDYEKMLRAYMQMVLSWESITFINYHYSDEWGLTEEESARLIQIGEEETDKYTREFD
jgi:hypothetical protein